VPADNGFRGDDDERVLPPRPEPTNNKPEELVDQNEPWPGVPTFENGELLPQHKVLKNEMSLPTKEAEEGSETEPKQADHDLSYIKILAVELSLCY
jgi:hypothetical protein